MAVAPIAEASVIAVIGAAIVGAGKCFRSARCDSLFQDVSVIDTTNNRVVTSNQRRPSPRSESNNNNKINSAASFGTPIQLALQACSRRHDQDLAADPNLAMSAARDATSST
jgi:hypothetical protein